MDALHVDADRDVGVERAIVEQLPKREMTLTFVQRPTVMDRQGMTLFHVSVLRSPLA